MLIAIVIHKDENTDYGVTVPDVPGCFSSGSTIEEAIKNAKQAIIFHLSDELLENGEGCELSDLKLRKVEELQALDECKGGVFAFVDVTIDEVMAEVPDFTGVNI